MGQKLYTAARDGDIATVRKLLAEGGVDVNVKDEYGWSALMEGSNGGHLGVVKTLIEAGADVNQTSKDGWSALMRAYEKGHLDVMKTLIEAGADVNQINESGCSALMKASANGHLDVVKTLIEAGTDVNQASKSGCSALMEASEKGHLDVVKTLIEAGADVNQTKTYTRRSGILQQYMEIVLGTHVHDGWTPLMLASDKGHLDVVKTLIEAGANVNQADRNGSSPLMEASENGHLDVVKTLIEAGADVNQINEGGKMALDFAVKKGHKAIIGVLKDGQSKMRQRLHEMRQQKEQTEQQLHDMRQQKEQTEQQLHEMRQQKEQTEQQLHDIRQQKEQTEQQLHDIRQQKEQTEQLHDMSQQKEQTEQQLRDMRKQKEQTEQQLRDMRQQKEQTEQQLHDMRQQKEQTEQQLRDMRQQKEQTEQQLRDMRHQKEQTEQQLHDIRQQMEACEQQAQRAEKRATSAEEDLRLSRQQAEEQQRSYLAQLPIQDIPQTKGSSWRVESDEIQVIEEKPLGVGGWGEVRVAMFRGVKVAAKFIHEAIISKHNINLFIREMNIAACVRHPNLLLFIGASLDDSKPVPVIITELMAANLRSIIHALSRDHVISIGTDVACGLNYLHLMKPDPIIHRDVSSANVLIEPIGFGNWRAKVSDYGSANFVSKVITTGPGNASYAAPESWKPKLQSPKMDVYSYGILLLEMATGQFPDDKLQAAQLKTLQWQEMAALVRRCICEDPDGRPDMKDILVLLSQLKK